MKLLVDTAKYPDAVESISFVRGDTIPFEVEFVNVLEKVDVSEWDKFTLTFSKTAKPKSPLDTISSVGEIVDVELGEIPNKIVFPLPDLQTSGNYVFDIQLENDDGSNKYTPAIGSARVVQDINLE